MKTVKNIFGNKDSKNEIGHEKTVVNEGADIKLFLGRGEDARMSNLQKQYLKEEFEVLPPIKKGDIKIDSVYFADVHGKLEVKLFFRNALPSSIDFDEIPLIIKDSNNEVVARQLFHLKSIGEIPAFCARQVKLQFDEENILKDNIDYDNLKISFEKNLEAFNTVEVQYENLPEDISYDEKRKYHEFLSALKSLKPGEVSIAAKDVKLTETGGIIITIVVRNASSKEIKIEGVAMTVIDARELIVAKGMFKMDDFLVTKGAAKIFNFIFNKGDVLSEGLDLSSWKVLFTE